MENENQKEMSKVLGLSRGVGNTNVASWAEIYVEIGRLKERSLINQSYFSDNNLGEVQGLQQSINT